MAYLGPEPVWMAGDGSWQSWTRAVFICGWHSNRLKLTCKGNLGFMGFVAFLETPACPFSHVYVAFPPLEKPHVKAITVAPPDGGFIFVPYHYCYTYWCGYPEQVIYNGFIPFICSERVILSVNIGQGQESRKKKSSISHDTGARKGGF